MAHLPECEVVTAAQFAEEIGEPLPDDLNPDIGMRRCHADCPELAAAIKRGLELAERFGWP